MLRHFNHTYNGRRVRRSRYFPFERSVGVRKTGTSERELPTKIITGLSQSRGLYVIARNSTLRYRDRAKDLRQIASELGCSLHFGR